MAVEAEAAGAKRRQAYVVTGISGLFLLALVVFIGSELSQAPELHKTRVEPAPTSLSNKLYSIATSCSDLSASCSKGCGPDAVFPNCGSKGAACTPFSFMPNIQNRNCSDWMDSEKFKTSPFFSSKEAYTDQVYAAAGSKDRWVLHGCDGAGIQTDCAGDIGYFEHYDGAVPVPAQQCTVGEYGKDHIQCPTFYHPGYQNSYPGYSCGWWRGYSTPTGIEAASADGVGAFGPHGADGDYSAGIKQALSNCETCDQRTALRHPYAGTGALAYFVGATWPWVCTADSDVAKVGPYTGSDANCYCDNEPWNGRGAGQRDYPHHAQVVYCGLYANQPLSTRNKMVCDFISVGVGSASADFRGVELSEVAW